LKTHQKIGLEFLEKIINCHISNQFWILATWYLNLFINILSVENNLFFDKSWFISQNSKLESKAFDKNEANTKSKALILFSFQDYVHFHVTNPMTPWDYLFSTMEETKQKFPELSDYSVSETTLEQVFLSFAKKQRKNFKDQWRKFFVIFFSKIHMCRI